MPDGHHRPRDVEALVRLEALGVIHREGDAYRPTRRFRGAMMRACLRLMATEDSGEDLRVPLAFALIDVLGDDGPDAELARYVAAMLPIQLGELPS